MHPAVHVTAGCIFLVAIQLLHGIVFGVFAGLVCFFVAVLAGATWWRIVRRLRFVFLAVGLIFIWQTPGIMLMPSWGAFSPTDDGVRLAAVQILRLLAATAIIAVLMQRLGAEGWVAALYSLAGPLRVFGVSPERFAVRLNLVLHLVDRAPARQRWLEYLRCGLNEGAAEPLAEYAWRPQPMRRQDKLCLSALLLIALGVLLCLV